MGKYTKSSRRGAVESSAVQQQNRTVAPTKLYFSKPWKYLTEEVFDLENGDHYPSRFARIRKWKTLLTISLVLTALVSTVSASAARQRPTSSRRMAGTQKKLSYTDRLISAAKTTGSWIKDKAKVAEQWTKDQVASYECTECDGTDENCQCKGDGRVSFLDRVQHKANQAKNYLSDKVSALNDKTSRKCDKCEKVLKDKKLSDQFNQNVYTYLEKDGPHKGEKCRYCDGDGSRNVVDQARNTYGQVEQWTKEQLASYECTKGSGCKDKNCQCKGTGHVKRLSHRVRHKANKMYDQAKQWTKQQLASYECTKGSNCKDKNCKCGGTGHVKRLSHRVRHKANKMYGQAGKTLSEAYGGVTGHLGKAYDGAKQWTKKQYAAAKAQAKKAGNYLKDTAADVTGKLKKQLASDECTKGENCKDTNCQCKGDGRVSLTDRAHHKAKVAGNWISDKVSGVKKKLSNGYNSLKSYIGSW